MQQLACNYLPHGYWFYVTGQIPPDKDPRDVDAKLIDKYDIAVSRATRCRRKKTGTASMHYLRHEYYFVLLATHGKHHFFADEGQQVRDAREVAIQFAGYSIGCKHGDYLRKEMGKQALRDSRFRSRVQVTRPVYLDWLAYFEEFAQRSTAERLAAQLYQFPYEPYAPVRKQVLNIVRVVNRVRRQRGRRPLDAKRVVRHRRKIVKVFST
ncbi:hypothetical protein [Aeoliella straminimaris]|uniref:hypothetical protein n=1 Tax=Aeoliella straminimaris TaxID=2954799 RepID=UPI002092AE79|nr:hypothetical protein [Aeoliella straminimaris]